MCTLVTEQNTDRTVLAERPGMTKTEAATLVLQHIEDNGGDDFDLQGFNALFTDDDGTRSEYDFDKNTWVSGLEDA